MSIREIAISPKGRFANQLLQYLTAYRLARDCPGCVITGYDIPEFGLKGPKIKNYKRRVPRIDTHRYDRAWLLQKVARKPLDRLVINFIPSDVAELPPAQEAADLLVPQDDSHARVEDNELLFHIRLEDVIKTDPDDFSGPLPMAWFQSLVQRTGLSPVFMGQLGDDPYSEGLRRRFPDARFLEQGSVLHDFQTLRHARHVAIAISTYSWLAAWLNPEATIYYPVQGLMNPTMFTHPCFIDPNDTRYRYSYFEPRKWSATPSEIQDLIHGPDESREMTQREAAELVARSHQMVEPNLAQWRRSMARRMHPLHRAFDFLRD